MVQAPPIPIFNERVFLEDLKSSLIDSVELQDSGGDQIVEDTQIKIIEREPFPEDVFDLVPPSLLIIVQSNEPIYGLGSMGHFEPYRVLMLSCAETLNSDSDDDRFMRETIGAADLRRLVARAVTRLGSGKDGLFSTDTSEINWVLPGEMLAAQELESDEGNDISVAPQFFNYDLSFS